MTLFSTNTYSDLTQNYLGLALKVRLGYLCTKLHMLVSKLSKIETRQLETLNGLYYKPV